jgi:hypothetical protein
MRKLMVYICIAAALAMTGLLSFKALSQSKTAAPAATPPPCTCGRAVTLGGGGTSQNGVIYNCTCGARACAVVLFRQRFDHPCHPVHDEQYFM